MNEQTPRMDRAKDAWQVTATTHSGKRYHYRMDTERDARALELMLHVHGRDIADTKVEPA